MNQADQVKPTDAPEDLTVKETVQRMQHDLATTGAVKAEHLLKVLGDPGEGVCVTLPAAMSAESRRVGAEAMGLFKTLRY